MPALASLPEKEITLLIQAAPGGVPDAVGRAMAAAAEKILGVPIIPTNITAPPPKGAGAIAMGETQRRAQPDGYTMRLRSGGAGYGESVGLR